MPSLHEPTVKPQSGNEPMQNESKSLPDLINEKDRVEEELKALGSVLDSVSASFSFSFHTNPTISIAFLVTLQICRVLGLHLIAWTA